ncbi:MAG: ABC 3 transporter family protein [Gammaproteobacteria bacterium]|nr:MAG: ABC 3 transporter family protein [Gammaproteobacteria bacterium]TND04059.1 MAG: ABC 3 transporter family protein [Gammaproteobacteria bacterium]
MNAAALDIGILGPALLAGLLVTATHVPLGQQVLARGIIFIDLAIAQIAGLGLMAAYTFGWEIGGWHMQATAFIAALGGALLLAWTERRWPQLQEALIGTLFVLAATGAILLLSANPHGGEHLRDLMVGQILWVSYEQLWPVAILYAVLLALWFGGRCYQRTLPFYLIFALAITASVQLVGVFLVFATLIIPAMFTSRLATHRLLAGYVVSSFAYGTGLIASALSDLPSGALIVWSLAVLAVAGGMVIRRT